MFTKISQTKFDFSSKNSFKTQKWTPGAVNVIEKNQNIATRRKWIKFMIALANVCENGFHSHPSTSSMPTLLQNILKTWEHAF